MTTTAEFSIIEYGKNSELSQLTEGHYPRSDAKKLSPIKNLNCTMNEVSKLIAHFQNVDKDEYGRLVEIAKVEAFNPAVRALNSPDFFPLTLVSQSHWQLRYAL
ncbi:hypothetical protein Peur_027868 [Populus x canadensis]